MPRRSSSQAHRIKELLDEAKTNPSPQPETVPTSNISSLSDISEFDINNLSYIYSTSNYGLTGTTDELLDIPEDELHEYLGAIGDNNLFFDKDFLDGDGEQLVYSAALNGEEVDMENGVITFTTVSGTNVLEIMAYDLGEDSISVYLIFNVE